MTRRHLARLLGALVIGFAIFALSNHRGSADVEAGDRKLEAFIEAAAAVDGVMAAWQPRIVGADDATAEALRHEANLEIRESIEQVEGISFAEYRDLRKTIARDPERRTRLRELMERSGQP